MPDYTNYGDVPPEDCAIAIGHITGLLRCIHESDETFFFSLVNEIEDKAAAIVLAMWMVYGRLGLTEAVFGLPIEQQIEWLGQYRQQIELGEIEN